ncbi:antibiotic biosynthesis monooxygenase [Pantoea sp. LMR881]|uniref:putative quinol monooxygenase n=1 Tax=Pantoea sp. LMR881 TaxID=3014336 RepID=UPI0022B00221|nr:antibiotic biosynthesis monooxygenase [Pantoea sp. LMR881]MCZ4060869.1 antibiotic biosynthesis monooxygenase [Pantoea sp. LMR881]
MIKLSGWLICKNVNESEVVQRFLPEHMRLTKQEAGCLSFSVTETADPLLWKVEELFTDKQTFEAHQLRTKASIWGEKTLSIRREYDISEVK